MLVSVYVDDRTIDIPVTITYWKSRPNKTHGGDFAETDLSTPFAASIFLPILVNLFASVYCWWFRNELEKRRMYRYVDEIVFCVVMNLSVAMTVGMTDFAQLYNLAILSTIPTIFMYTVENTVYLDLHVNLEPYKDKLKKTFQLCGCCCEVTNYTMVAILALIFTVLIYVAILVVHHVAPDARGILHAAVYMNLIFQLGWRGVIIYIHGKTKQWEYLWMERVWSAVAVTVCTHLVFWAI